MFSCTRYCVNPQLNNKQYTSRLLNNARGHCWRTLSFCLTLNPHTRLYFGKCHPIFISCYILYLMDFTNLPLKVTFFILNSEARTLMVITFYSNGLEDRTRGMFLKLGVSKYGDGRRRFCESFMSVAAACLFASKVK